MSASREKKQRQGLGDALTQKERNEQKEAQAKKRKTILYWIAGVVVVVLVAALLIWDSGLFQRNTHTATIGDHNLSAADMQYYYAVAKNNELTNINYTQQLMSMYGQSYESPYDQTKGDADQIYDAETGKTYEDYFKEQALEIAKSTISMADAAKAANYSLSTEAKKELDASISDLKSQVSKGGWTSFNAYLKDRYGNLVTEGLFRQHQNESALANEYYTYYQNSLSYTEEQLNAYAEENPASTYSYDYRLAYISGAPKTETDDEGNTVEPTEDETAAAMEAAKAKVDALVSAVEAAGADEKDDVYNAKVTESVDATSSYADPENNLKTAVLGSTLSSSTYFSWLSDTSRQAGDVTSIESGSGYYVLLFKDRYLNNDETVDVRHILVKAELTPADEEAGTPAATTPTQEQMDAAKTKAQSILDEFNSGDKTEDSFAALAEQYSEDRRNSDGSLYSAGGLYPYVSQGDMVPNFDAWIFDPARQSGDTDLVENNEEDSTYFGWHVMYFVGKAGPKWHEVAEDALKSDEMTAWSEGLEANYTASYVSGYGPAEHTPAPSGSPAPSESPAPTESGAPAPSETPAA